MMAKKPTEKVKRLLRLVPREEDQVAEAKSKRRPSLKVSAKARKPKTRKRTLAAALSEAVERENIARRFA